ncbi:DUF2142 domain-containing protein [Cellulomonas sp. ICMP 17802]|uniref:DUF2142 domain-containing protein n=1 Tax=Cellulomonas sp. ICMP 17802 TaxID=3239199 RepID=UPI00351B3DB6
MPSRRLARTWPAVLVVVALVAVVLAWFAQPSGPITGAAQERLVIVAPGENVGPDSPVWVDVHATEDGLAAVQVVFATFVGTISCTLEGTLYDGSRELVTSVVPCADLRDNQPSTVVTLPPLQDSAGADYRLRMALQEGSTTGPTVWTATNGAAVVTRYDPAPHRWDLVGTVLERVAVYAPWWGAPAGTTALVVLGIACLTLLVLRPRWALFAVLGLVLVKGLLWSLLIPPLQGMDEGAHFAYVQYVGEEHAIPDRGQADRTARPFSDSLVLTSARMGVSALAPTDRPDYTEEARRSLLEEDRRLSADSDGATTAAGYPPAYYGPAALFYLAADDDTVAQIHAVRLWSVLLGLAAIAMAWLFSREAVASPAARAAIVTSVALQPMLAHQFAIVNNDALALVSGFAALWLGARLTRSPRHAGLMALAGVAVGVGLLAKPYAIVGVLPVAVGWILGVVRERARGWRVLLGEPVLAVAGVAATYGVWLAIAAVSGISSSTTFPQVPAAGGRDLVTYLATQYDPQLVEVRRLWVTQLWGSFGWVNTPLPDGWLTVIGVFEGVLVLAIVAWLVLLVIDRGRQSDVVAQVDRLVAVCVASTVGTIAVLYGIEYAYFHASGGTELLQGRYALAIIPALVALPGLLVQRFSRGRWSPTATLWGVAALVAVLFAVSVVTVVGHFTL